MTEQEFVELQSKVSRASVLLDEIKHAKRIAESIQNKNKLKIHIADTADVNACGLSASVDLINQQEVNHIINFLDQRIQYLEREFRGL